MSMYKQVKDRLIRLVLGTASVPSGLAELHHYFRSYGPIRFQLEPQQDGSVVALSKNFRYGSIITRADDVQALEGQVEDAILTAFSVPSFYAKEADIHRVGEGEYAVA